MVVKSTLWETLGLINATDNALREAVLVAPGVRGVFDEPGDFYGSNPDTLSVRRCRLNTSG